VSAQALAVAQEFPGRRDEVHRVREYIAGLVGHLPRADEIVLCVSELATNAILHSASGQLGGTFTVTMTITGSVVTIAVKDQGLALVPSPRRPVEESGRGLGILTMLADDYALHEGEAVAVFDTDREIR
jgi:anti-sigma regulatory factor (Ser/Thr protein kinase)